MTVFKLPDLGEGLAEAEIREWYVKVGDDVTVDQLLVSMETAKAVVDVPSPYSGKIAQLHGDVNTIIKTGSPLITFESDEAHHDSGSVVGKLETSEHKWDDSEVKIGASETKSSSVKATPAARLLAQHESVDLAKIQPTGPRGLIIPDDVKRFLSEKNEPKWIADTEKLHGVRRIMAQTMAEAHQQVVPVTIVEEADITSLSQHVDVTSLLLKAMVHAAKLEPALNAWFSGSHLERKLFDDVHIGIAVDTAEGLFVPVIKNAQACSLEKLREKINSFKLALETRSLAPSDMQGATITLSNFGTITGRYATPIIVPPTVAILGCGRSRETAISRGGQVFSGRILPLSLTIDHRAVTGGEASRYLKAVIQYLENP
jgi:2-oxoisovalerate dehydrogenase E2 component (dihydrolipoyl transacylase)